MKKLTLTTAILLGLATTAFAENDNHQGGLFMRGAQPREYSNNNVEAPILPIHGQTESQDATPLGSGIAVLLGLGAAYLVGKRRREE